MGEFELLAKLRERLPPAGSRVKLGSGDDAAVTVPGGAMIWIGRYAPEFLGIDASVTWKMPL